MVELEEEFVNSHRGPALMAVGSKAMPLTGVETRGM